jgi:hypothetical protein
VKYFAFVTANKITGTPRVQLFTFAFDHYPTNPDIDRAFLRFIGQIPELRGGWNTLSTDIQGPCTAEEIQ